MSKTWIIVDLETTGLHPEKGDVIIDIAAIKGDSTGITDTYQSYVHPGDVEVSPFVQKLTGIPLSILDESPSANHVMEEFKKFIGDVSYVVIGHNISFDVDFLKYYGVNLQTQDNQLLDTNDFATLFFPEAPSHSLEVLAHLLKVEHTAKHTALGDVHATYALLQSLLTKYQTEYKELYTPWISELLDRSTSWGGRAFFDLTLPPRTYEMVGQDTIPTTQNTLSIHETYAADTLYTIPLNIDREEAVCSLIRKRKGVLLTDRDSLSAYKKRAHGANIFYLDSLGSFIDPEKVHTLLSKKNLSTEEALWAIRISSLPHDSYIHVATLPLTYRERQIIQQYCVDGSEEALARFATYLASQECIITSYYHYFFGPLARHLQSFSDITIDRTAELLPSISKASKTIVDEQGLTWRLQRIKDALSSEEEVYTIAIQRDVEALEHVVRYFFQNVDSLRKGQTQDIPFEIIQPYDVSFIEALSKGLALIENSIRHLETDKMNRILLMTQQIREESQRFFGEQQPGYIRYGVYYHNAVHLIHEYVDLDIPKAHLLAKETLYLDTRFLPEFSYLRSFEKTEPLISTQENSFRLLVESHTKAEDNQYLHTIIPRDTKSLLLLSSASKVERVFDYLYDQEVHSSYSVLAYGKSGGAGKITHLFAEADAGVLIQKITDTRVSMLPADLKHLFLTYIPFFIVQGRYFDMTFGKQVFGKMTMPLTYKALADFFDLIGRVQPECTIHLLDERFSSKGYGQDMVRALQREYGVKG